METFIKNSRVAVRPNFPPVKQGDFWLDIENENEANEIVMPPLRAQLGSRPVSPLWKLTSRSANGLVAGGCAVALPQNGEQPSPRQLPHPVLGEWISALRYTGLSWMECGSLVVAPGFSEEAVIDSLWEGLTRLMDRNGVSFLIGTAPVASLALEMTLGRGARALEPFTAGSSRYFLYVK